MSDADSRGLPPGVSTPYGDIYSVSMYHQMHCLARMRKTHWIYQDAINTGEFGIARAFSGRTGSQHVQHCYDYLRQSILCAGDMTLEWPKLDGVASGFKVDGWNVTHTCKSRVSLSLSLSLSLSPPCEKLADTKCRRRSTNTWTNTTSTRA